MANVYTISVPGATFVAGKCMLGLFNGIGSGKVARLYKAFVLNNQVTAVTGLQNRMRVDRFSTGSGGVELLVIKHDSASQSLPSQIVCSTNMSYTSDATLRRFLWCSEEPLSTDVAAIEDYQTNPYVTKVVDFDWSYQSSVVQPYTIRPGFGVGIVFENAYTTGTITTPVGSADFFFEFTVESA